MVKSFAFVTPLLEAPTSREVGRDAFFHIVYLRGRRKPENALDAAKVILKVDCFMGRFYF